MDCFDTTSSPSTTQQSIFYWTCGLRLRWTRRLRVRDSSFSECMQLTWFFLVIDPIIELHTLTGTKQGAQQRCRGSAIDRSHQTHLLHTEQDMAAVMTDLWSLMVAHGRDSASARSNAVAALVAHRSGVGACDAKQRPTYAICNPGGIGSSPSLLFNQHAAVLHALENPGPAAIVHGWKTVHIGRAVMRKRNPALAYSTSRFIPRGGTHMNTFPGDSQGPALAVAVQRCMATDAGGRRRVVGCTRRQSRCCC
jgi:hypothetical protein